ARTDAPTALWTRSAFLPTGARVIPRGAPVPNLISHLGRGFFALPPSLTKPPIFGDCSESTGLPPEDVYRTVRVRTFEPGGQPGVRPGCVPPRPQRRAHRPRRPATARDRPLQSQRHTERVSALWSLGLSGQAVASDAA